MRHIEHPREPRALTEYRATPDAYWDGFADKRRVLEVLCGAQRKLCCYCTRRISVEDAHVEHYRPQRGPAGRPELQLHWRNLFAVCAGSAGAHCDGAKADQPLEVVDPGDHPERHLVFASGGTVSAASAAAERDVAQLALNHPTLRQGREAAIKGLIKALGRGGAGRRSGSTRRSAGWSAPTR